MMMIFDFIVRCRCVLYIQGELIMINKNDEMISDFCGDRNIIFLQDRPHNFKLFCMLNPANVPYMVLVGFNGKCFY